MKSGSTTTTEIRHVIWDWNGTLLDDVPACMGSINRMLERRDLPIMDDEQYRKVFGFPVQDFYTQIGFDFSVEDWNDLAHEYHEIYLEMSKTTPLRAGALSLLERIRSHGLAMSLLSASEQSILAGMLDSRGISDFFEGVYGLQNLHAASKLSLGERLLAEMGVPPGRALLIGDTVHDYDVASELGCRCLLVAGGHQAEHRLAKCDCALASDLDEAGRMIEDSLRTKG